LILNEFFLMAPPPPPAPAQPDAAPQTKRPLSPHLSIYKPQLTSGMSIFHKITGVGMAGGIVVLVIWLACLSMGKETYDQLLALLKSPVGLILLFGWTWAFFYHLCCGIRHLLWAAGWSLSIKAVYISGYIALAISTILTLGLWYIILDIGGKLWR